MEGWIKLHKKIWDNPISAKPNYLAVWLYLLSHANYKDREIIWNSRKRKIKRGCFIGSISKIAKHLNLSKATVSYILDYLKVERMIERSSSSRFTVFTVKNYDRYQQVERKTEHKVNSKRTPGETTKKYKKEKKDKIIKRPSKKYSSLDDITEDDLVDISQSYKVPLGFVRLQFEKMKNWLKSSGKTKKDYKATLRNFVLGDMQKQVERRQDGKYRPVDARHVK